MCQSCRPEGYLSKKLSKYFYENILYKFTELLDKAGKEVPSYMLKGERQILTIGHGSDSQGYKYGDFTYSGMFWCGNTGDTEYYYQVEFREQRFRWNKWTSRGIEYFGKHITIEILKEISDYLDIEQELIEYTQPDEIEDYND